MNKHQRQDHESADQTTLPNDIGRELSHITTEVLDVSDAPPLAPKPPLTPDEVRTILMSLLLTMFLAALDQTIVATALPTIGRQFNDVSNLSWVITSYLLASTAVAPVFGTLSDIYGRRVMITVSLVLFTAGSILCALAPNMTVLIIARGLQGLGGGGIMPVVQTVISDVVSPRERGKYQAYFSGVWMAAGLLGPVLGGVFAEHLHWSMIFWINVPLAIGALVLLLPKMGKIPVFHRRRKIDWLGGLLLMAAAVEFMLVLSWGGSRYAWLSPTILGMIGGSVALALAFVWHARHADEPFLPLTQPQAPAGSARGVFRLSGSFFAHPSAHRRGCARRPAGRGPQRAGCRGRACGCGADGGHGDGHRSADRYRAGCRRRDWHRWRFCARSLVTYRAVADDPWPDHRFCGGPEERVSLGGRVRQEMGCG